VTIWTVPAEVIRVVDGDTVALNLSLGWHIYLDANVRIYGVNAPELSTMMGKAARDFAVAELPRGMPVVFESKQLDKYGRPLGALRYPRAGAGRPLEDFGHILLQEGHAVPYLL